MVFSLGGWTPQFPTGLACPVVLRYQTRDCTCIYRAITVCGRPFQNRLAWVFRVCVLPYNPALQAGRFRLFPFRSPLLRESFLFLRVLRCFSSPGSLLHVMYWRADAWACPHAGFPIRTSPARTVAHTSPELCAVYHVLHRHWVPRHPPCALSSLSSM